MTSAAQAIDLTKRYGDGPTAVTALDAVSLDIPGAEFTAVMGPSGSGKSTLMHCLAGLDTPTSGHVMLGETDLGACSDRELTILRREQVGFIFQSFNLIPTLDAKENILLPLDIAGREPDEAWFDLVVDTIGLGDRLTHRPSELSGGQQQRVAAARALVTKPTIIFADEPTGNLDSVSSEEVLGFLQKSVRDFGQTIVMVTHEPTAAAKADRVVFLADGRIVDEIRQPTADGVLDMMKSLDTKHRQVV
jgi:putative ABC transport system ATP-binding protein